MTVISGAQENNFRRAAHCLMCGLYFVMHVECQVSFDTPGIT